MKQNKIERKRKNHQNPPPHKQPNNKRRLGAIGEKTAVKHLSSKGFKIIEKNFRKKCGEIDIIALEKDILVFVEVKTRKSTQFGSCEEAVTYWKKKSLIKTSYYYKLCHPELPDAMRVDLVCIYLTPSDEIKEILHYRNIIQNHR